MTPPPAHPDDDLVRVRIAVYGRVQGVWFRGSAQSTAQRLGVVGWARNLPDGSVEILAQGPRDAVDKLVAWCQHGPSAARVDRVSTRPEIVQDDLHEFRIR
jgi:acylphosphatase